VPDYFNDPPTLYSGQNFTDFCNYAALTKICSDYILIKVIVIPVQKKDLQSKKFVRKLS